MLASQHRCPDRCHVGHSVGWPANDAKAGGGEGLVFLDVGDLANGIEMGAVVKLNHRHDAAVFAADHEISAHAVDPVVPIPKIVPLLDAEDTRQLHLGKDEAFGQGLHQPVIERLFGLGKQPLGVERPCLIVKSGSGWLGAVIGALWPRRWRRGGRLGRRDRRGTWAAFAGGGGDNERGHGAKENDADGDKQERDKDRYEFHSGGCDGNNDGERQTIVIYHSMSL